MSPNHRSRNRDRAVTRLQRLRAHIFAALGDETRLYLVSTLCSGDAQSVTQLSRGSHLTRQAITKHLRVLEHAGIVRNIRAGRQSLFEFVPEPVDDLKDYLDFVSQQWDDALDRLRSFVEQ